MSLLTYLDVKRIAEGIPWHQRSVKLAESKSDPNYKKYDIFLSHSYQDREIILGVKTILESGGLSVYVDWIDDAQLDRKRVTKETAARLRTRMQNSRSLLYIHTPSAPDSKWMPWELGYVDARTDARCAIVPVFEGSAPSEFVGQEYLGLYPYLDYTVGSLYIHKRAGSFVGIARWISGANPSD